MISPRPVLPAAMSEPTIALQPIISVATGQLYACEALARFGSGTVADQVIAQARQQGLGAQLEIACVRAAHERLADLPPGVKMSVNMSPDALSYVTVVPQRWMHDLGGLIVEVTEQAAEEPEALALHAQLVRARGAQVAVDDVGSGYAGLLRLASIRPDSVKIDKSIVTGVRDSVAQAAVLESLVAFSHRIGATVVAEGVETMDDLTALAEFDVDYAQGWIVGRPDTEVRPIADEVRWACRTARAAVLASGRIAGGEAGRSRSMHEATSLMTLASGFAQVREAIDRAARAIAVDVVGLSVLGPDGRLRELVSAGLDLDSNSYVLDDYPSSLAAMRTGESIEVHMNDSDGDTAEQIVMRKIGAQSLLIVPFGLPSSPVGILEFFQLTHRRWSAVDIEQGRGLALHVANAWSRMAMSTGAPAAAPGPSTS